MYIYIYIIIKNKRIIQIMPANIINVNNASGYTINTVPSITQRAFTLQNTGATTTGALSLLFQSPNAATPNWDLVNDVASGNIYFTASPNNGSGPTSATTWLGIKGSNGATTLYGPTTIANSLTLNAGLIGTTGAFSSTLVSSTFVTTLAGFANNGASGTNNSFSGAFVSVKAQNFTDTGTLANSNSIGNFNSFYIGAPTLLASNTSVTTSLASTVTIAGPPVASTNQTITTSYTLNIQSGVSYFGGLIRANAGLLNPSAPWGNFAMQANQNATGLGYGLLFSNTSGNMTLNSAANAVNITVTGNYAISLGFETTNVVIEAAIYLNGNQQGVRILDKYNNGNAFPEVRHTFAVIARLSAGDTVSAFVSILNGNSTGVFNTYSRGFTFALISQIA